MIDAVSAHGLLRPHRLMMALLFLVAATVGYLILPGERERIAMLERDGKYREALTILERRFAAGDRSQRRLYQLQDVYLHFGDLEKSRRMLELLAEQRPRDAEVQSRLAAFYKQTQDEAAYVRALEARIALRYAETSCRELIAIHRRRGDFPAELAALQSCRQRGYRRVEDLVRLAMLLASEGDLAQSSQIMRSIDDLRRLRTDQERLFLFTNLIELDQPREAQRRAVRWLKGQQNEEFALGLVELLADSGRKDFALQLAGDVGEPGSAVALVAGELLVARDETVAARTYLRGWLSEARFDDPLLVSRFVEVALDAEDPPLALLAAERFGLARVPVDALMMLAEALVATDRLREFEQVRSVLGAERIAGNPLLAAAMRLRAGSEAESRTLLAKVKVDELDEWRLALWAKLMEQTGRGNVASATLRQIGGDRSAGPSAGGQRAGGGQRIIRRISRAKGLRVRRAAGQAVGKQVPTAAPVQFPASGG